MLRWKYSLNTWWSGEGHGKAWGGSCRGGGEAGGQEAKRTKYIQSERRSRTGGGWTIPGIQSALQSRDGGPGRGQGTMKGWTDRVLIGHIQGRKEGGSEERGGLTNPEPE